MTNDFKEEVEFASNCSYNNDYLRNEFHINERYISEGEGYHSFSHASPTSCLP